MAAKLPAHKFSDKPLLSVEQIRRGLSSLPDDIANKRLKVQEVESQLSEAKHNLKVVKAEEHLKARNDPKLTSNDDRKAYVDTNERVNEIEMKIITLDGKRAIAKIMEDRMIDWFNSLRKQSNLIIAIEDELRREARRQ